MSSSYLELLCSIEIRHAHFADGRCPALELRPTVHCARMLERYRLHWLPTRDGGSIHRWTESGEHRETSLLGRLFNEATPFAFTLTTRDPEFERYTADSFAWEGRTDVTVPTVAYFSNLALGTQSSDDTRGPALLLHGSNQPMATRLPVLRRGSVTLPSSTDAAADVKVATALGAPLDGPWTRDTARRSVDLRAMPEGRFIVRVGSEMVSDAWWSEPSPPGPWGVVELFVGGRRMQGVPPDRALLDVLMRPAPRRFAITLEPRATCWRYLVISATRSTLDETTMSVVSEGDLASEFTREKSRVVDGRLAAVFESARDLPLLQSPKARHTMTLNTVGGRGLRLPYPRAEGTRIEPLPDGARASRFVSEVYVYV
jgi:hypothetical protein